MLYIMPPLSHSLSVFILHSFRQRGREMEVPAAPRSQLLIYHNNLISVHTHHQSHLLTTLHHQLYHLTLLDQKKRRRKGEGVKGRERRREKERTLYRCYLNNNYYLHLYNDTVKVTSQITSYHCSQQLYSA